MNLAKNDGTLDRLVGQLDLACSSVQFQAEHPNPPGCEMIFFGESSLRNACTEFLAHYHQLRDHTTGSVHRWWPARSRKYDIPRLLHIEK
jgi:hypothetical protein